MTASRAVTASRTLVAACVVLAGVLGAVAGLELGRRTAGTELIYCHAGPETVQGTSPCPPPRDVVVLATWGDVTTRATWTGAAWHFRAPVFGQWTTTRPASAWQELTEARP